MHGIYMSEASIGANFTDGKLSALRDAGSKGLVGDLEGYPGERQKFVLNLV